MWQQTTVGVHLDILNVVALTPPAMRPLQPDGDQHATGRERQIAFGAKIDFAAGDLVARQDNFLISKYWHAGPLFAVLAANVASVRFSVTQAFLSRLLPRASVSAAIRALSSSIRLFSWAVLSFPDARRPRSCS